MNREVASEFVFLGQRNYVHGTSMSEGLFTALNVWGCADIRRVSARFHRVTRNQGVYRLCRDKEQWQADSAGFVAAFVAETGGGTSFVGLTDEGGPVTARAAYDEDRLTEGCQVDPAAKAAFLASQPDAPFLNVLIALTKRLHLAVFPREGFGQWYCAGYDLPAVLLGGRSCAGPLRLSIAGSIGSAFTRSPVTAGSGSAGHILFAREAVV